MHPDHPFNEQPLDFAALTNEYAVVLLIGFVSIILFCFKNIIFRCMSDKILKNFHRLFIID